MEQLAIHRSILSDAHDEKFGDDGDDGYASSLQRQKMALPNIKKFNAMKLLPGNTIVQHLMDMFTHLEQTDVDFKDEYQDSRN